MTNENSKGKVLELFITQSDTNKTRKNVDSVIVDELGIQDDKFYAKNPMRSILISSTSSYEITKENGIDILNGSLGENILIDINPYSLVTGDKIKIGSSLLEITQNCTLCQGLSSVNAKLPKLLKNDRGIFAKVVKGSYEIKVNDKVEILSH